MNLTELKAEHLKQRKARNKVAIAALSTLISDIELEQRKLPEGQEVDVLAKVRKSININKDNIKKDPEGSLVDKFKEENAYLDTLLPQQLSNTQILSILASNRITDIGSAMKILKTKYQGQYNGKEASKLIREYLS